MEALRFGRSQHLIGIVHRPQGVDKRRGVLLWNTGISHRVGPFRSNVEIAETLASLGFSVLRFDLAQLGDSLAVSGEADIQARSSADIADAIQYLSEHHGCLGFILLGHCSSAVDAYYYAKQDARVQALVMVDGFVYPTRKHRFLSVLKRASSPYRWQRFLRNSFAPEAQLPENSEDRFEANYPTAEEAGKSLQMMAERGTRFLVIYTGGFAPYFSYRKQFADMLPGFSAHQALDLHYWPDVDHLFLLLEDRQRYIQLLTTWCQQNVSEALPLPQPTLPKEAEALVPIPSDSGSEAKAMTHDGSESAGDSQTIKALTESVLACFHEALHSTLLDETDSFFDYGGTSVLAIKAIGLINSRLNLDLPPVSLYTYTQAAQLAAAIVQGEFAAESKNSDPSEMKKADATDKSAADADIAIIGMACHVPGAQTWQEFWDIVVHGKESITRFAPEELDPSIPLSMRQHPSYVPFRGVIEGDRFDHRFFKISKQEALFTDPQQRILLQTCWQALEDSGYSDCRQQQRIAVYAGVGNNTYLSRNLAQGHYEAHSEKEFLAFMGNDKDYVATRIAHSLDLRGPAVSVHTACSTSLVAVIEAVKCLQSGQADLALAGAAAVNAPMASGHLYQEGGIFAKDGHCRPFDADASGTMFCDGSATLVLKRLTHAERDGDHIYAVIKGWGLNNDGAEKSSFAAPSVQGQAQVIRMALDKAGVDPRSIGFVECHGTGTPIGDPIEIEGLKRAYEAWTKDKQFCAIGSVKANIGHLTAAAGGIGLIKAALCVKEALIPAQSNFLRSNPGLRLEQSPFYVPQKNQAWASEGPRRAAVSSFGVGGTNSHIIIEEAPQRLMRQRPSSPDPWTLLTWSAKDQSRCLALGASIQRAASHQAWHDLSYTLSHRRSTFAYRQALTLHPRLGPMDTKLLEPVLWESQKLKAKTLVLCFSGQGSQYPHMGLELAREWPRFEEHYRRVLDLFEKRQALPLRSLLASAEQLNETRHTQPALFALEWALAHTLLTLGLPIKALIGHSLGEITAACIAGVLELDDAVDLVFHRARLMQAAAPGSMLAVRATAEALSPYLQTDVEIAAINSKQSSVLAGPKPSIEKVRERLEAAGIASKALATSHAFHSSMMQPVLQEFAGLLRKIPFKAPQIPIYSTVTAEAMKAADAMNPDYWVQQIRKPVLFSAAVRKAADEGASAFIEVGPKDALTRFMRQDLGQGSSVLPMLAHRDASELADVSDFIATLWSQGGHRLFQQESAQLISAPVYPFSGERLWLDPRSEDKPMLPSGPSAAQGKGPDNGLVQKLQGLLEDLSGLGRAELSPAQSWNELGLDSLLLTQWALRLQKEFPMRMNLQLLQTEVTTLATLAQRIQKELPSEAYHRDPLPHTEFPAIPRLPALGQDLDSGSGASEALVRHVMDQQFLLMQKQLELLARMGSSTASPVSRPLPSGLPIMPQPQSAPVPQPASGNEVLAIPDRLTNLPMDGTYHFLRDSGPVSYPRYKGSLLAQDEQGQASVFIEDPEHPGEFWQVVHD